MQWTLLNDPTLPRFANGQTEVPAWLEHHDNDGRSLGPRPGGDKKEVAVALHRLASITIGVPNVEDTCVYYSEFGLTRDGETFSTRDGGEQLRIVDSPYRRLFEFCVGADDTDDLERVTERLNRLGVSVTHEAACVSASIFTAEPASW